MAWIRKRPGCAKSYEARWRDPDGRERSRSFDRKLDAQRFLVTVEADKLRGSYVDPNAGKVTLQAFAESWLATQSTDPTKLSPPSCASTSFRTLAPTSSGLSGHRCSRAGSRNFKRPWPPRTSE